MHDLYINVCIVPHKVSRHYKYGLSQVGEWRPDAVEAGTPKEYGIRRAPLTGTGHNPLNNLSIQPVHIRESFRLLATFFLMELNNCSWQTKRPQNIKLRPYFVCN